MARKLIPTNTKREDCVMTPQDLANALVEHFKPHGKVLEPCKGTGNFIRAIEGYGQNVSILWCEITEGKDFFNFKDKVDWIITNPPYSKMRKFIQQSMKVSDNIVFLTTINHLWLKARIRDIEKEGFGIKEIVIFETPDSFPQSGFQIGAFYLKKDYIGDIKFKRLEVKQEAMQSQARHSSQA